MLLGILFLYFYNFTSAPACTPSAFQALYKTAPQIFHDPAYGSTFAILLFLAFFLAFAIKVPMFPFHTWLPDAHVEAPTAGSVILAGVLLKMGTYGFVRFSLPFFPDVVMHPKVRGWMIVLSIIGIIYGALVSLMQKDMKKLVAYSSVSHLGFCTLGIFALEPSGIERIGAAADQSRHLDRRAVLDRRHSLRAAAHPRDRRVRRHLERHAGLRHHHHDHVPVLDGTAAAERLRRRVHHPAGHLHGELEVGGLGGARA